VHASHSDLELQLGNSSIVDEGRQEGLDLKVKGINAKLSFRRRGNILSQIVGSIPR